jgi:hypothetical protein
MNRSSIFLIVVSAVFLPVFAIPLFVDPIWWAERFGWETDGSRDLAVYFGRCLGAIALAVVVVALRASRDPASHRAIFDVLAIGGLLLAIAHLRGTIEDSQPFVEHLETGMYAVFAAAAWWCRPDRVEP